MGRGAIYSGAILASFLLWGEVSHTQSQAIELSACEKMLFYVLEKPKAYGWLLRRAAQQGDEEKIDALLEQEEVNVNNGDRFGFTALHLAAAHGHLGIVRKLIMAGADARASTRLDKYTPLHSAAEGGRIHVVRYFVIERGLSLEVDAMGDTPFHTAAQEGHHDVVQFFSQQKQNINFQDKRGLTPLHWAVWRGDEAMLRQLIQQGADVNLAAYELKQAQANRANKGGQSFSDLINEPHISEEHAFAYTPLHTAVERGFQSMAQALVEAGADVQARTEKGSTILHLAAIKDHTDLVSWALKVGVDAHAINQNGRKALDEALAHQHTQAATLLKPKTSL